MQARFSSGVPRLRRCCAGWGGILALTVLAWPMTALAHVGSPDVYYEGNAGPYRLLVTIRPPEVVPGVAQIQVLSLSDGVGQIQILPLTMQGPGATLAPTPDTRQRSGADPQLFTGNLWIMLRGSWKVQMQVEGGQGKGELAVPVAAVSMSAAHMGRGIGAMLAALGMLLFGLLIGIIRAANGPAQVGPRQPLTPALRLRSYIGMGIGAFIILAALVFGYLWWGAEASANDKMVYRIPRVQAAFEAQGALLLRLENPNTASSSPEAEVAWAQGIKMDDLIPDHGHLMHLFLVRTPDMKSFWHLHPDPTRPGEFVATLPAIPAGHYSIYADIVHGNGFPETQVGSIDLPEVHSQQLLHPATQKSGVSGTPLLHPATQNARVSGTPLSGDDSGRPDLSAAETVAQLSDGYRMVWERGTAPLRAQRATVFTFRVEDKDGKPATDLENYMGMSGHAVFIKDDGTVFAHVHPEGSVSMAALTMAQSPQNAMAGMAHGAIGSEVSFPYGFPQPGDYHLFVQIKRAGHVETGSFIAHIVN